MMYVDVDPVNKRLCNATLQRSFAEPEPTGRRELEWQRARLAAPAFVNKGDNAETLPCLLIRSAMFMT